jgi:hypothetical protein
MHSLNQFLEVSLREEIQSLPISIHSIPTASRYSYQSDSVTSFFFPALIYTVYSYRIPETLCSAQVSFPSHQPRHGRCLRMDAASIPWLRATAIRHNLPTHTDVKQATRREAPMADSPMMDAQATENCRSKREQKLDRCACADMHTTMCSGCYVEQRVTRPTSIRPGYKRCIAGIIRIVAEVGVFGTRQTMQPLTWSLKRR